MEGDNKNSIEDNVQLAQKENSGGDYLPQSSSMKQNGDADDGAAEKLVAEDGALKTNKDASEVKFISVDSQNGDAKIDIENMKIAFAGMGKEELMKFANDPFWVRVRWFLFILFWLLWVAMLAGAIGIIVMAPKCAAPAPLKWWEQSPLYQLSLPAFKDGSDPQNGIGDFKGLKSKLQYVEELGVKGIALSSILKGTSYDAEESVEDFKDVDPGYGTLEEMKALLALLKEKGIHLLLSLVPNHTSKKHEWFRKSEENDTVYKDYYIWHSGKIASNGRPEPPNNWISVTGGSAWTWSTKKNAYYLHQFHSEEPDLNFRNPAVVQEFKGIFQHWLEVGVSGFQLQKVEYLLEDERLEDETVLPRTGAIHDEYGFYSHAKTTNQPGVIDILEEWKTSIRNYSGEGVLSVAGNLSSTVFLENPNKTHIVDLLQTNIIFSYLKNSFTAKDLNELIQKYYKNHVNITRPTWQLTPSSTSRVATRLSPEYVDGLNMVTMLLPGTPITLYGEELGMEDSQAEENPSLCSMSWSNSTNAGFSAYSSPPVLPSRNYEVANVEAEKDPVSSLSVYKDLVEARNTPCIMYGSVEYSDLNNGTVFAFTRKKSGHPGYLVVFNTADESVNVNFGAMRYIPEELNVQIVSSNIDSIKVKAKVSKGSLVLPPRGALVATFVPKDEPVEG